MFVCCVDAQIGWADRQFSVATADEDGDNGVGDDVHSFAYDGFRQRLWNGSELTYEDNTETVDASTQKKGKKRAQPGSSVAWKAGDTIGCLLEISHVPFSPADAEEVGTGDVSVASGSYQITLSYSVNGKSLGKAFSSSSNTNLAALATEFLATSASADVDNKRGVMFPAISLEQGESMIINIGQRAFRHEPATDTQRTSTKSIFSVLQQTQMLEDHLDEVSLVNILSEVKAARSADSGADFIPIDLDSEDIKWPSDLHHFGLDHLKHALTSRGLKAGGTLQERAERLFSVKGLGPDAIPNHLLAGKPKGKKLDSK